MGYIRFLLAVCVIFAHAGPLPFLGYMAGGAVAVQCFFIMSGFYMALVLNEKYDQSGRFYWNRFSKIFSGYWIALLFALVVMHYSNDDLLSRIWNSDLSWHSKVVAYASNFSIFGTDAVLFLDASDGALRVAGGPDQHTSLAAYLALPQSWSLAIELAFYLIAPLCCRSVPRLITLFFASYIALLSLTSWLGEVDPWSFRNTPVSMKYFAGGALCYFLMPLAKEKPAVWGYYALALIVGWIVIYDVSPTGLRWLLLPSIAIATPFIIRNVEGWLDKELGELSYMLYLVHVPVLFGLQFAGHSSLPLVLGFSIVVAWALHQVAKALDHNIRNLYPTRLFGEGRERGWKRQQVAFKGTSNTALGTESEN